MGPLTLTIVPRSAGKGDAGAGGRGGEGTGVVAMRGASATVPFCRSTERDGEIFLLGH
jgi:hypothetical protein